MRYQSRQCTNPACRLRFPVDEGSPLGAECPLCKQATELTEDRWRTHPAKSAGELPGPAIHGLLDNVRSLRNVGAMFRSSDGAGVEHLHLCGFTPTPAHPKLAKTALGAEQSVAWTRHFDSVRAVEELKAAGMQLWALEGGDTSESLFELPPIDAAIDVESAAPIVLVVGHEVSGVDVRVLDACDRSVCIPMAGTKGSLNVSVAFSIAAFTLRHALRSPS